MAYTDEQIKIINEQAKAKPGYKYVTKEGKVFKGTSNNRLMLVASIDTVAIRKQSKVNNRLSTIEDEVFNVPAVSSYFEQELNLNEGTLVLQTLSPILEILENNIFQLDIAEGCLIPTDNLLATDLHWEFIENKTCISPK
jgi:hypothetical protein